MLLIIYAYIKICNYSNIHRDDEKEDHPEYKKAKESTEDDVNAL